MLYVWMLTKLLLLHTETYNLAYTHLLTNPDRMPKTRSFWRTLEVNITRKKWA